MDFSAGLGERHRAASHSLGKIAGMDAAPEIGALVAASTLRSSQAAAYDSM